MNCPEITRHIHVLAVVATVSKYIHLKHLHGASRLGMMLPNEDRGAITGAEDIFTRTLEKKNYELTDHLGNVRSVITDMKLPDGNDHFLPEATTRNYYYPFGMERPLMTTRVGGNDYRFGYNGKENDRDWNKQDYGFRTYDPRVARFLSIDPLKAQYPWYSPFQFAGNTPIQAIDLDGLEPRYINQNLHPPNVIGGGFNLGALFDQFIIKTVTDIQNSMENANSKAEKTIANVTNDEYTPGFTFKLGAYLSAYLYESKDVSGLNNYVSATHGHDLDQNQVTGWNRVIAGVFVAIDITPFKELEIGGKLLSRAGKAWDKLDFGKKGASDILSKGVHFKFEGNHFMLTINESKVIGIKALEEGVSESTAQTAARNFNLGIMNEKSREELLGRIESAIDLLKGSKEKRAEQRLIELNEIKKQINNLNTTLEEVKSADK